VPHASGDVDDSPLAQLDLLAVEHHRAGAGDDVIEFVGALVVVQPGVVDLDVMDLGGGAVLVLDQAADLAAGLRPGLDFGRVGAKSGSRWS
jgi:hypothetical protein